MPVHLTINRELIADSDMMRLLVIERGLYHAMMAEMCTSSNVLSIVFPLLVHPHPFHIVLPNRDR